jgi:RNA polymerase sigma-70 factor (ECF subfamily)
MAGSEPPFDEAGFSALVDRHHPALYAFARRRLADREAIEDVLADTFLVAWRRRTEIPDPPLPWLYGVCLRTISTHKRSARRRSRLWGRMATQPVSSARDPAEMHADSSEITRAYAALSDGERETLRLVAWDGLSTADAAAVLGLTPGAFRVRFHRARRSLEKHLGQSGHERVMDGPTNPPQTESAQ